MSAYEITVLGLVQGIGYRSFVAQYAHENGITGYVRNHGGTVKLYVDLAPEDIGKLTYHLRYNCPPGGHVENIIVKPVRDVEAEKKAAEIREKGDTLDELREKYGARHEEGSSTLTASQVGEEKEEETEEQTETISEPEDEMIILDVNGDELDDSFRIIRSDSHNEEIRYIPMDLAICDECRRELFDPADRRYRYPFISCKSCGPRYSIIKAIPYNRENTTMSEFRMCPDCRREYQELGNRRQVAETISCRGCGPKLRLYENRRVDDVYMSQDEMMNAACEMIRNDKVGAIKDIGGFHFMFSPMSSEAATKVRNFKQNPHGPMAIMFPDVETIKKYCFVSEKEEELLKSNARPIVLLTKKPEYIEAEKHKMEVFLGGEASIYKADEIFAYEVCGESDQIGAILPSTGLQVLMTDMLGPIGMTSGNIHRDPIMYLDEEMIGYLPEVDESEMKGIEIPPDASHIARTATLQAGEEEKPVKVEQKKKGIDIKPEKIEKYEGICIDFMLTNTRDIVAPMDDSIVQVNLIHVGPMTKEVVQYVRRSIGYVPYPIILERNVDGEVLGAGGDNNTTFAIGKKNTVYMSEHFGGLYNRTTLEQRRRCIERMENLFNIRPQKVYTDLNPEYKSVIDGKTKVRETATLERPVSLVQRQHHSSHVLSVAAENDLRGRLLGIVYDGNGYGLDATSWGSEIFSCLLNTIGDESSLESEKTVELKPYILRSGALLPIKMIDGNAKTTLCCYLRAAEERQLLSMSGLNRVLNSLKIDKSDYGMISAYLKADIGIYYSSSVGKLFDAVAALLGVRTDNTYGGECAIMLERAAMRELNRRKEEEKEKGIDDNDASELLLNIIEPHGENEIFRMDQTLLVADLLEKYVSNVEKSNTEEDVQRMREKLSLEFHEALIEATVTVSDLVCSRDYIQHIALSGGSMYNRILLDGIAGSLERLGYTVYLNKEVPCGDGGLALGQLHSMETT